MIINDVVRGALKIDGMPETACFTSFEEFIRAIPNFIAVEVPLSISNVVIGSAAPGEDERHKLWLRFDTSNNFLGQYIFTKGQWQIAYTFAPNQLVRVVGDSREIDDGFKLADNTVLTNDQANFLQLQWKRDPTDTFWEIFDVLFVGY